MARSQSAPRRGSIIEGLYELTDDGERIGDEVRFVGRRLTDSFRVDVRVMGPDASPAARRRFSEIVAILGRLDQENCLSATGAGQLVDRTLYVVTELTAVGPLAQLVGRALPDRELADIGLQLMRGLEHLHLQGVVLGGVTPSGIVLGEHGNRARLRIVDLSNARLDGRAHRAVQGVDEKWLAPEVAEGNDATEASDVYAAGLILRSLVSSGTAQVLRDGIGRLLDPSPDMRLLAGEACFQFSEVVEESSRPFDLSWLPHPEITAISTAVYEVSADTALARESAEQLAATPLDAEPFLLEGPQRRARWMGYALAGVGLATIATIYGVSTRGLGDGASASADPGVEPSGSSPAGAATAAVAAPRSAGSALEANEDGAGARGLQGNPIVWLAQVNRTDLGAVLPLAERKALLEELGTRGAVDERVNHRWNSMLDLWQSNDAERPCAVFAAALARLDEPPAGDSETDLLARVVVPSPAPGSQAGVAPDESCEGLGAAFEEFKASEGADERTNRRVVRRRHRSASTPPPPPPPPEVAAVEPPVEKRPPKREVKPTKPKSVATKLDDDLREF